MFYFLTSSPLIGRTAQLNNDNVFADELIYRLEGKNKALFIAADPENTSANDSFSQAVTAAVNAAGGKLEETVVLDTRNASEAETLVGRAEMIILSGGHVPTQNEFFRSIGLKGLLGDFTGVILGISAGTMNSARIVYAEPELEGEATDPDYMRFLPGLGITMTRIIPHFTEDHSFLDGLDILEDIILPDSIGHRFYALPDGSYIMGDGSMEMLCGDAWLIEDGIIRKISSDGEKRYI